MANSSAQFEVILKAARIKIGAARWMRQDFSPNGASLYLGLANESRFLAVLDSQAVNRIGPRSYHIHSNCTS